MTRRPTGTVRRLAALRMLAAAAGLTALVGRFIYGLDFVTFTVGNYFGYLTIQSNIAAVAMFAAGAVAAWRQGVDPHWLSQARLMVTAYLGVAGIVFTILVDQSSTRGYRIEVPWSDQLLHYWIPAYALLDWILAPGRRRVPWRFTALVLGYPLVWGMFTMVRGSIVGWYPYFFLDPYQVENLGEFALYAIASLVAFSAVAAVLLLLSRLPGLPLSPRPSRARTRPSRRGAIRRAARP